MSKKNIKQFLVLLLVGLLMFFGISVFAPKESLEQNLGAANAPDAPEFQNFNTFAKRISDTKILNQVFGSWVNYKAADGRWKQIDTKLEDCGTTFCNRDNIFEAYFPKTAGGMATIVNNNRFNPTLKSDISSPPFSQNLRALGVSDVNGIVGDYIIPGVGTVSAVKYPNAYPFGDLFLFSWQATQPKLARVVKFNSNPGNIDLNFLFSPESAIDSKINKQKVSRTQRSIASGTVFAMVSKTDEDRGFTLEPPQIWDSGIGDAQKSEFIRYTITPTSTNDLVLTKHIKSDFFTGAQFPVYTDDTLLVFPDASTGATTVDGQVHQDSGGASTDDWVVITRSRSGNDHSDTGATIDTRFLSASAGDNWGDVWRGVYCFDTASIDDTFDITSSTFSAFGSSKNNTNGETPTWELAKSNPTSTKNNLVNTDYATTTFDLTRNGTGLGYDNFSTTAYNKISLNSTGLANISKTTSTCFGTATSNDIDNVIPAADAGNRGVAMTVVSADAAGTSTDPYLLVESSAPASASKETENTWFDILSGFIQRVYAKK